MKGFVPVEIYGSHVDVTEGVILGDLSLRESDGFDFGHTCLSCGDGIASADAVPVLGTASAYGLPPEFRCGDCALGVPREDEDESEDSEDGSDDGLSFS